MTRRGPRLIEVNAGRCNGLDFHLLASLCNGYNAFDATADAFLSPEGFAALPPLPPAQLACRGMLATLVSDVRGQLVRLRHLDEVQSMASVISFEPDATEPGDALRPTTDLDSCAGTVLMAHQDGAVLEADYTRLRELQTTMFEVRQ